MTMYSRPEFRIGRHRNPSANPRGNVDDNFGRWTPRGFVLTEELAMAMTVSSRIPCNIGRGMDMATPLPVGMAETQDYYRPLEELAPGFRRGALEVKNLVWCSLCGGHWTYVDPCYRCEELWEKYDEPTGTVGT